jgi:hypothetical protein
MNTVTYTPWRWKPICHRPTTGSHWWFGNFSLGVSVDSHPRFFNVIVGLLFVEIGVGWTREAVLDRQ